MKATRNPYQNRDSGQNCTERLGKLILFGVLVMLGSLLVFDEGLIKEKPSTKFASEKKRNDVEAKLEMRNMEVLALKKQIFEQKTLLQKAQDEVKSENSKQKLQEQEHARRLEGERKVVRTCFMQTAELRQQIRRLEDNPCPTEQLSNSTGDAKKGKRAVLIIGNAPRPEWCLKRSFAASDLYIFNGARGAAQGMKLSSKPDRIFLLWNSLSRVEGSVKSIYGSIQRRIGGKAGGFGNPLDADFTRTYLQTQMDYPEIHVEDLPVSKSIKECFTTHKNKQWSIGFYYMARSILLKQRPFCNGYDFPNYFPHPTACEKLAFQQWLKRGLLRETATITEPCDAQVHKPLLG